ncbi:MAG TPA: dTDP-4-dehydrorhamnose 3,5-epimerase [Candidatus Coprenecus stercorigallinarum]|nr:dTDP-4-dehydrorhamnose 3,5-epimerase [Candidatus Coprenecus stercorigallinarum]
MNIIRTDVDGVLIVEPKVFGDSRGYFMEVFSERDFRAATGLDVHFVQDNESMSSKGVLRGLHFQKAPYSQSKLVRVVSGSVQDVAVDLRAGSPTFGKYVSVVLSGENRRMFYIPEGFAHGFLVLEDNTVFQYKCGAFYEPSSEGSVRWDDPDIGVEWMRTEGELLLSDKDRRAPLLSEQPYRF